MNTLFDGRIESEPGPLFYIKNKFGHRQVKKQVMECVNHVNDFLFFVTSGLVCLLVMELLEMASLTSVPQVSEEQTITGKVFLSMLDFNY